MSTAAIVEAVTPGLRTDVVVTDHATQEPLRLTTYRGHVRVRKEATGIGILRVDDRIPVALYLSDSLPYPEPPAALDIQLSLRHFLGTEPSRNFPQGAVDAWVQVVPDPRGGTDRWLQIGFAVQAFFMTCEIGYVVTAASPYQRGV